MGAQSSDPAIVPDDTAVKPQGQPIDPDLTAIDDEDSTEIYQPESTTGTVKDDKSTEKPQEPDSSEEAPVYEIGGVKFSESDVKKWSELAAQQGTGKKQEAWEADLHKRGLELNNRDTELKRRETETQEVQKLTTEYKQFKQIVDAHPEAREYFQKLINTPQSAMQPVLDAMQKKIDDRFSELDEKEADVKMKVEFPDYSKEVCDKVLENFDFENPYDIQKALYLINKALNMEAEIQKRIAVTKDTSPITPPLIGTVQPPPRQFKSVDEAAEDLLKGLNI